jgi:hypothetical protein
LTPLKRNTFGQTEAPCGSEGGSVGDIPPWAGLVVALLAALWWAMTPKMVTGSLWWVRQGGNAELARSLTRAVRGIVIVVGALGLASTLASIAWRLLRL